MSITCQLTGTLKQREKLWDRGLEKKVVQAMQIVNQYTTDTLLILHQQFTNTSLTHYWYYPAQLVGWFVNRFLTDTPLTIKCHLIDIMTDCQKILDRHLNDIATVMLTHSRPRCWLIHWLTPPVRHDPLNLESAILDNLPLPKIKDGKMACFGFCTASSLIWGDGGLLFHFILSKIVV